MKKVTLITALMLVCLLSLPVLANSLQGTQGLIYMPTADTQSVNKYSLGFQLDGDQSSIMTANYGINESLEAYLNVASNSKFDNTATTLGVKGRILQEAQRQPALAAGVMGRKSGTDIFVVASKSIDYKGNLRGHVGFESGKGLFFGFNKIYNHVTISSSDSMFSLPVTNCKVEYYNNDINLGADFHLNKNFNINLSLIDLEGLSYGIEYSSRF